MSLLTQNKIEVRSTVLDLKEILANEILFQRVSLERLIDSFSQYDGISNAYEYTKNY